MAPSNGRIDLKVKPGILCCQGVEARPDWRHGFSGGFRTEGRGREPYPEEAGGVGKANLAVRWATWGRPNPPLLDNTGFPEGDE